jgi:hypothetical protein
MKSGVVGHRSAMFVMVVRGKAGERHMYGGRLSGAKRRALRRLTGELG